MKGILGIVLMAGALLAKDPAVLFTGSGGGVIGSSTAKALQQAGWKVDQQNRPGFTGRVLSYEQMKRYNVIVVDGLGEAAADGTLTKENRENAEALGRYLNEGGGLVLLGHMGQRETEIPPQELFLAPLGLKPAYHDQLTGADSRAATVWKIAFDETTDILRKNPLTEGVERLWYPVPNQLIGGQFHTISCTADSNWTVLARTASGTSIKNCGEERHVKPVNPLVKADAYPLATVRQVGKGRIAYLAVSHEYVTGDYADTVFESIFNVKGLEGRASGGRKLLLNLLAWAAEPSKDVFGGAAGNPDLALDPLTDKNKAKPYDWSKPVQYSRDYEMPGVIGARSTFSSGSSTPQEWIAAAKRSGLRYVAFLEEFAKLSPEKFEELKQLCRTESTEAFTAFAGFTIDDEVGNHYFYFGSGLPYPPAGLIDPVKRVWISVDADGKGAKGQISYGVQSYVISICIQRLTAGNYNFSHDAMPLEDGFSAYNALGLVTTVNGRLVDDAYLNYKACTGNGMGANPMAVTLMDSVRELAGNKYFTVYMSRIPTNGDLVKFFNDGKFYPENPNALYVTDGPKIKKFVQSGERDYVGHNAGDFVWQNYRWQLACEIVSEKPLASVKIYDGKELYRSFDPKGKTTFSIQLDLNNSRQHYLFIEAIDSEGRRAVSREVWTRNQRLQEFMCGDRQNQLTYGKIYRKKDDRFLMLGGNSSVTPYHRVAPNETSASGYFRNHAEMGAPGLDGGVSGNGTLFLGLNVRGKELPPVPNVSESRRLLNTGDIHIGDSTCEYYFDDDIPVKNVWHTMWSVKPSPVFRTHLCRYVPQVDPDQPLAAFLEEYTVELLADAELPKELYLANFVPRESQTYTIRGADGFFLSGNWEVNPISTSRSFRQKMKFGDYVAFTGSPVGSDAVFPLTDDFFVSFGLPRRGNVLFGSESVPKKKGEKLVFRSLMLGVPRITSFTPNMPASSNEIFERFRKDYGLDGGAGGYAVTYRQGKEVRRLYPLEIDGSATAAFEGDIEGRLVSSLPIRITGMNRRWSAYLYDFAVKKARPVGVWDGSAFVTVIPPCRIFVGHPVTADNPEVVLQLTQTGNSAFKLEIHNPGEKDVTVHLKSNPGFPLLNAAKLPAQTDVPAKSSIWMEL